MVKNFLTNQLNKLKIMLLNIIFLDSQDKMISRYSNKNSDLELVCLKYTTVHQKIWQEWILRLYITKKCNVVTIMIIFPLETISWLHSWPLYFLGYKLEDSA